MKMRLISHATLPGTALSENVTEKSRPVSVEGKKRERSAHVSHPWPVSSVGRLDPLAEDSAGTDSAVSEQFFGGLGRLDRRCCFTSLQNPPGSTVTSPSR